MGTSTATTALKRKLGKLVDTSEAGCWAASFDSSKISFLPEAVITPRRAADIGLVLELANKHRVPVTVRGRGTTLMGSAAPVRGGWVIDMLKLNAIRIDDRSKNKSFGIIGGNDHRPTKATRRHVDGEQP